MTSTTAWLCAYLGALTPDAEPPGSPPDGWEVAAAVAERAGLAPGLAYGLARGLGVGVPSRVAARLDARFRQALARHVVMSRDLASLLRALADADVATIPLKGAYLAEMVYPHPALRPLSDIDLLVRPDDRLRADEILRGLGYRRGADAHSWAFDVAYDGATFYDGPGGARVDVHWRLLNEPRYPWRHAEADAVWDRATAVTLAGERALALCPEDLVLSLATHLAVHHGLTGLVWYWDLALVLDRWSATLDWDRLRARAERWRVRRALAWVLHRLGELFTLPGPGGLAAAEVLSRGPRAMAVRRLLARSADRRVTAEYVLPLLLTDRVVDGVRAVGAAVCPPPSWLRARYGSDASSLFRAYLAHGARMATVVRGQLRG